MKRIISLLVLVVFILSMNVFADEVTAVDEAPAVEEISATEEVPAEEVTEETATEEAAETATEEVAEEKTVKDMFLDMPDNWSTAALVAAVENGLIGGSNGYIKPDDFMTRAEMATIMARATDASEEADITAFTDVKAEDWFYSSMAKAVYMKAFKGSDNQLNPENYITRQEAFVVLARVFGLDRGLKKEGEELDYAVIEAFADYADIADWAKDGVYAIVKEGYVAGNDGKINPLDNITRAEFAVVMDRLIKYYIDEPGDYTPNADGNIMVRSAGVNINGLTTEKTVFVGDLKSDAKVFLNNCDIKGVTIRGGHAVLDGKYSDMKAVMKAATLDVTKLGATVLNNPDMKFFIEDANLSISLQAEAK